MRPEKKQVVIELSEEEKLIVALLKANENKMDLAQLKVTAALSGKNGMPPPKVCPKTT